MPPEVTATVDQLSSMIAHAVAPAFLLTAVASLVSVLTIRMHAVVDRIRALNRIADDDAERLWLKDDITRLKRREVLLNQSLALVVMAGIGISLLLVAGFVAAFLGLRHEYGAGVLFIITLILMMGSLVRFLQDIRISLREHDHHG